MSDYDDYEYGRGENDMEYLYQNYIDYQDNRAIDLFDEDGKMAELGIKGDRELQDPVHKFTLFVQSVARKMSSDKVINLTNDDIQYILNQIGKIPTPEYKNPTGFVLGYWLTSSETSYNVINKKRYAKLKPNLKNIEYPLEEKDVIRYSRFWILHDLLPEI